ncbi:MAG: phosphatidate cytidylyltransferase [Hyphomonadaceae bacterium]
MRTPAKVAESGESVVRPGVEDLGPRLLSAIALIPLALGAAVDGGAWLAGATGAAVVAMSWEWASMSRPERPMPAFWTTLAGALGAVMLASLGWIAWALAWSGALATAAAAWPAAAPLRRREAFLGVLYIALPCVAFLWIRALPNGGLAITVGLFAIIWAADGAAYFAGRLVGGPRLLPQLSAQKTVAGLAAALAAGALAGAGYGGLLGRHAWPWWAAAGLGLAACGMAGDLFESFLKRRFGVKDASQLIPGHGGVLDRLDGLMAATVAAAALLAAWPGAGRALLEGAP